LRILLHDYAGHPFQAQLSRALARRGHSVLHLHAAFFQTPKGRLARAPEDPSTFAVEGLELGAPFAKYRFLRRRAQERAYGKLLARRAAAWVPDLVLAANTPLDSLRELQEWCRALHIPFIFWLQDIYSLAIDRILRRKIGPLAAPIAGHYRAIERRIARDSDALVLISEDFRPTLDAWGVPPGRISVIENWAPRDELPALPRDNAWSREHGLADKLVLLYAGTLGLKHNPALLAALAERFAARPEIALVVVSEGPGAEWLAARQSAGALANLRILPFQPYQRLPEMLASGDVLLAVLEAEAGAFAVPSKVLSYFCAGRPLLAAIPSANLAARLIRRERVGLVVEPDNAGGFVMAAERLVNDAALRAWFGQNALDYAGKTFDIEAIVARFEAVFAAVFEGGAATA
jgi:glycosyltransferase involved in cell wall biosynthesis